MSVKGSLSARLYPWEAGFDNLVLAGDWTRNDFNIGNVEATVMSGMLAANTISEYPDKSDVDRRTYYAYTWSLLFFAIPNFALLVFIVRHPNSGLEKPALWKTIAIIFGVGLVLDVFLAYEWFEFPNQWAVIGFNLPAFPYSTGFTMVPNAVPIEEFGFYFLGGVFMAATYAWGDVTLFSRYRHADPAVHAREGRLIALHPRSPWIVLGVLLALGGIILASQHLRTDKEGFPGYFCLLTLIGVLPPLLMFKRIGPIINWQAFLFMYSVLLMISIVWEATLGVPYEWWKYKKEHMLGLYIRPWNDLPVEAVLMWLVSAWAAVMLYETFRLMEYSGKSARRALLGDPKVAKMAKASAPAR